MKETDIIKVSSKELKLFAKLYDDKEESQAKLPSIHSMQLLNTLSKFSETENKIKDLDENYFTTTIWQETNSQKDNTIKRKISQYHF